MRTDEYARIVYISGKEKNMAKMNPLDLCRKIMAEIELVERIYIICGALLKIYCSTDDQKHVLLRFTQLDDMDSMQQTSDWQCCSCLFVSGRTVVYGSHYKRPQFPPKVDYGGPNYRLQASHVASHVDWPSRTLLMVRPARQDAVLLRHMTTTALVIGFGKNSNVVTSQPKRVTVRR